MALFNKYSRQRVSDGIDPLDETDDTSMPADNTDTSVPEETAPAMTSSKLFSGGAAQAPDQTQKKPSFLSKLFKALPTIGDALMNMNMHETPEQGYQRQQLKSAQNSQAQAMAQNAINNNFAQQRLQNQADFNKATLGVQQGTLAEKIRNDNNAANKKTSADSKQEAIGYQKQGLLNNLDELQNTINNINSGNSKSLTQGSGPVSGRIATDLAGLGLGKNKDDITTFNTLVQGLKMQYGKDFSGRYNNTEGEEIEKMLLPVLKLPPSQQGAAIKAAKTLINNKFLGPQGTDSEGEPIFSKTGASNHQSAGAFNPSTPMPAGAEGIAMHSDGTRHWVNKQGQDFGAAE